MIARVRRSPSHGAAGTGLPVTPSGEATTHREAMARIRSVAFNVLRASGVQKTSLALYANAVSFDQLLALSTRANARAALG